MTRKAPLFRAALSAAILSFAGVALAAGPQSVQPDKLAQTSQPGTGTEMPSAPSATPESTSPSSPSAEPSAALNAQEGMDVVNAEGQKIGEVSRIEGDQIILSVGGFLGIGARDVAVPQNQLQMSGSGEDAKLMTTMSEQELEQLPEYESPTASGGESAPPTTGGAPTR